MQDLGVVVVSYRTPDLTRAAVTSALHAARCKEVVVVDNASGDETLDALRQVTDERVAVHSNDTNAGFGAAANIGASRVSAPILLFLNSDAILSASAAELIADQVSMQSGWVIVGPRLVDAAGQIQRSAGLQPRPGDLIVRSLGMHRIAMALGTLPLIGGLVRRSRLAQDYESAAAAAEPFDTNMVSGACFAIGRDAFLALGEFDERFFMYFEDADLCRRALKAGMAIRYLPQAVVPHIGGASSTEDYHFSPRHARSMRQYLAKWYGPPGAALAMVLMLLRAVGFSVGAPRKAGRAWQAFAATLGFGGGA